MSILLSPAEIDTQVRERFNSNILDFNLSTVSVELQHKIQEHLVWELRKENDPTWKPEYHFLFTEADLQEMEAATEKYKNTWLQVGLNLPI